MWFIIIFYQVKKNKNSYFERIAVLLNNIF